MRYNFKNSSNIRNQILHSNSGHHPFLTVMKLSFVIHSTECLVFIIFYCSLLVCGNYVARSIVKYFFRDTTDRELRRYLQKIKFTFSQ